VTQNYIFESPASASLPADLRLTIRNSARQPAFQATHNGLPLTAKIAGRSLVPTRDAVCGASATETLLLVPRNFTKFHQIPRNSTAFWTQPVANQTNIRKTPHETFARNFFSPSVPQLAIGSDQPALSRTPKE
jgi:hypothetical protein